MKDGMIDVIVIGAGAAGMCAAICAARAGAGVMILEKADKPGRKLLLTGNGKCNLTHEDPEICTRYHSSNPECLSALRSLFNCYGSAEIRSFFAELGLLTHERDGYVYPRSDQSASVLRALTGELQRLGVRIRSRTAVTALTATPDGGWLVSTDGWQYRCCKVILACGSCVMPQTGSDGSGYTLAASLGHHIILPVPALTGLVSSDRDLRIASGTRTYAKVTLEIPDQQLRVSETGQIQWADDGISGICVMQLSRYAARALCECDEAPGMAKPYVCAVIDFLPEQGSLELEAYLYNTFTKYHCRQDKQIGELLGGVVPDRVAAMLQRRAAMQHRGEEAGSHSAAEQASVYAALLKHFTITVSGVRDFQRAQVCAGGVDLTQVDLRTGRSLLFPDLFFAGEIMDVDGPCGGYNLQWAWASGMAAGTAAAGACIDFPSL